MLNTKQLSARIVAALNDAKAIDIKVIDVRALTDITDQMIICHGTSDRHVFALAKNTIEALKEAQTSPASVEGEDIGEWILVDYVDVLLHVMKRETREYYDLESLWDERFAQSSNHEVARNNAA